MDLSRDLEIPPTRRLDKIALVELEARVDHSIGTALSKQQVLNIYLDWLRGQLVQDMFIQRDSPVEKWAKSLRDRGFDKDQIWQSFKHWQQQETLEDPSTLRRFLMVEQELRSFLETGIPSNPDGFQETRRHLDLSCQKDNQESQLDKSQVKKRKKRHRPQKEQSELTENRIGRQRTGANDIPVTKRRHRGSSTAIQDISGFKSNMPNQPDRQLDDKGDKTLMDFGIIRDSGNPYDSDKLIITRETNLLDAPPSKMSRDYSTNSASDHWVHYKGDYLTTVKAGVLENESPGNEYTCKRCNQKGHWVHLCPTNLDPSFDVPPDPDYRCNFCQKTGDHFATLCPRNDQYWSLTQQRKDTSRFKSITMVSREKRQLKLGGSDSYRPKNVPRSRYKDADVFRPQYRDEHSSSPQRRGREDFEKPVQGSPYRGLSDRATRRNREREPDLHPLEDSPTVSRSRHGGAYNPSHHTKRSAVNEGRLFYEDGDVFFTTTDAPSVVGGRDKSETPNITMNERTPRSCLGDSIMRSGPPSTGESSPTSREKAAADADDFLNTLDEEIYTVRALAQEDMIEATCIWKVNAATEEVCGETDTVFYQNNSGILFKRVTNPPFCDEVVRLFANRSNPIVHPRIKRRSAVEF